MPPPPGIGFVLEEVGDELMKLSSMKIGEASGVGRSETGRSEFELEENACSARMYSACIAIVVSSFRFWIDPGSGIEAAG